MVMYHESVHIRTFSWYTPLVGQICTVLSRRSETRGAPDRMRRGAPHAREDATHAHDSNFQLQGRRRQDDDRREPGGHLRRPGPSDPARRPRPAGVCHRLLRPLRPGRLRAAHLGRAALRRRPRGGGRLRRRGGPRRGGLDHRPRRPERDAPARAAPQVRPRRRLGLLRRLPHRLQPRDAQTRL